MKHSFKRLAGAGLATLLALAGCTGPSPQAWSEFRGPTGQGLAGDAEPPLHWGPGTNIVWKQALPGSGWSSPILHKGRIILTTALTGDDGNPASLRTMGLDPEKGGVLWDREVFVPKASQQKHRKNSHASATPIAEGNRVYVHFGHMGTACLDLEGKVIWRQESLQYSPVHGNGGSPILVDDKLIFSCDGASNPFIVALDKNTGAVVWKKDRITSATKKFSFSTPLLVREKGRRVVVSPGSGAVWGYDPNDGTELWRVDYGEGYSVIPRPVQGDGLVYVGTGFDRASVCAIKLGGDGNVTDTHVVWKVSRGAPLTPSMLLVGDELYFVADNGMVSCADARTGEVHWQERIGGAVSASPVYARGRIYITTEPGNTVVLKAGKEFSILAQNDLAEKTYASSALAGSALILRTESSLYRIEER